MQILNYVIPGVLTIFGGILIYLIRYAMTNKNETDRQIRELEKQIVELQTCLRDTKQMLQDLREKVEKIDGRIYSKSHNCKKNNGNHK
jgi:t-SNARE complex subunit (syntaxin)